LAFETHATLSLSVRTDTSLSAPVVHAPSSRQAHGTNHRMEGSRVNRKIMHSNTVRNQRRVLNVE